jgi:hypothetical protein
MRRATFTFFFLLAALPATANDVYVAQSSAGSNNGSSCANAYAQTYFNDSSKWTSGTPTGTQIGPGTTVHLCGTISTQLAFQGSGSSGNPVTVLFEPGAMMSANGNVWSANPPFWLGGFNYLTINGGTGNVGGASTNIQATNNGSGQTYHDAIDAIEMDNSHDITVLNMGCGPLYTHTSASDDNPGADSGGCLYANPLGANVTVHDSTFHDATDGLLFSEEVTGTVNLNVYNNTFYNIDHDLFTSCGTSSSGFYFHNNLIHAPANWDTNDDSFHHDGWILAYFSGTTCTAVFDYNNKYYGDWGTNNTSPIFWDDNGGNLDSAYVFNDIFMNSNATQTWNNGINAMVSDAGGPAHIWNNTVICPASGGLGIQTEGLNMDVRNNVSTGCSTFFSTSNAGAATVSAFNYNLYANLVASGSSAFSFLSSGTNAAQTLAQQFTGWKTIIQGKLAGAEANSSTASSANLNSSGQPNAGSPVIGAGTNLYSTCSGQANPGLGALCNDYAGTARPSSGAWDIGAYVYGSSSSTPTSLGSLLAQGVKVQ